MINRPGKGYSMAASKWEISVMYTTLTLVLFAVTVDAQNRGAQRNKYNGQSRSGRQQLDMSINMGE